MHPLLQILYLFFNPPTAKEDVVSKGHIAEDGYRNLFVYLSEKLFVSIMEENCFLLYCAYSVSMLAKNIQ